MKAGDRVSNYIILAAANPRGKNRYFTCECINCGHTKEVAVSNLRAKGSARGTCTLDRKDNNGPYSAENCRWATAVEQQSNTSRNVLIEYGGGLVTEAELSRLTGVPRTTIQCRRKRGLSSAEELLSGPRNI